MKMNDLEWTLYPKLESLAADVTAPFPIRTDFQLAPSMVFTNRFIVTIDDGATLHEFQIVGIPEGRSKRMTKMFMDTAIEKSTILNSNQEFFATDHNKIIIAWKDLREHLEKTGNFDKDAGGWHLVNVQDDDNRIVPLHLRYVRLVNTDELQRYVATEVATSSWNLMTWNENPSLNALNIVITKYFDRGVIRLGAKKFFVQICSSPLSDRMNSPLCTIRGYYYSARPGMGKILFNVNSCTSAFFSPIRLDKLMSSSNLFGHDWPSLLTGLRVYI